MTRSFLPEGMRLALVLLALLLTPAALAHGGSQQTQEEVDLGVARVVVVHDQNGSSAACRVSVYSDMRPLPQTTHVGRSCPGIPHLD